jgi:hypothetical protein
VIKSEAKLELVYLNKYRELKAKIGLKMELKINMIKRKTKIQGVNSIILENMDKAWTRSGALGA